MACESSVYFFFKKILFSLGSEKVNSMVHLKDASI